MDLQESIKSRRSIREFTDKKPDWREIIEAIHSAQYAPMVGNLFPMKFLIYSFMVICETISGINFI